MEKKQFVTPNQLHLDSIKLARKVHDSGYKPDFIVALWRGGAFPGCVVQGTLARFGHKADHVPIRTSSRDDEGKQAKVVRIHAIGHLVSKLNSQSRVLIVDDVFDSGHTIQAFKDRLHAELDAEGRYPAEVRIACLFYKGVVEEESQQFQPVSKLSLRPDYYEGRTNKWLVFPHELNEMSDEEIIEHIPEASAQLIG